MKRPVLAGILFVAVVLAAMVYYSLGLSNSRVEVCIEFKGVQRCKTARAATEQDAIRRAVDNACGEIASGVTDSMACTRSEPIKINILK